MKLLYVHQYFKVPSEGGAIRSWHLARTLAAHNIEVHVITAHNKPGYAQKHWPNMVVHYVPVPYSNEMRFGKRMWAFLRFVWLCRPLLKQHKDAAGLYATSTPLTVGLLALYARAKWKMPYIFEVRDLWPRAPIELGAVKWRVVKESLQGLEKLTYHHAQAVVSLSKGMQQDIQQTSPDTTGFVVPNMADTVLFEPAQAMPKGPLHIVYTGTFGWANGMDHLCTLVEMARHMHLPICWTLAGQGARLNEVQQRLGTQNITYAGHLGTKEVQKLLQTAHFALVLFGPEPVLQTNSPNKFFDALAAGVPVLVNVQGWLNNLVQQHGCGYYLSRQNVAQDLKQIMAAYQQGAQTWQPMSQAARKLAQEHFSTQKLSQEWLTIVKNHLLHSN